MEPVVAVLIACITLVVGLIAGWLLASRSVAPLKAERDRLDERSRAAETAKAAAEERASAAPLLRTTLDEVTKERDSALRDLASERAAAGQRAEAFELRLAELREAKDALSAQFSEIGGKILGEAQKAFLERADQRFAQADERSGERLKALLKPVETTLKRYEENVGKIERERTEAYGNLTGLISAMREGQEAVRGEAARLVNALRAAPKARGRWGEQQLRNVLETCGLAEHTDFEMEVSVSTEDGRLRPDAVIRVPGGKSLVIDAKVSLNAYQDAYAAIDEAERARFLQAHAAAMKAHVTALSAKAYWSQFEDAPEFVIMFVPGEHFLSAATDADPGLWDYAFQKRVLLAAPTNLVALARTVAGVWRQEKLAAEARQIGALGKEMYERLAKIANDMRKVGTALNSAVTNYNAFASSLETRALVTGRKFRDLNIETGDREIEAVPPVESLARSLVAPEQETQQAAE
ncbi:DNA recombination protein RmuC [Sphingomonas oryzagri]|uniref:DNA recombination protein RmuC homolog n=1 Tax=Sphingomonas oryzagri TaxID=3042314 RepID=A0ABT6MYS0_9SPHN|nr:DNA recombination protein RmuC [Sphingomonas oryzagri]MDH7637931.1 DNA recombination protein RmuC [Sphingomonas oryzagri]